MILFHVCRYLSFSFFFLMIRRPPRSTLFPYTTLSDLELFRVVGALLRVIASVEAEELPLPFDLGEDVHRPFPDRKSTRLNSSHSQISYAVFCLKKKKKTQSTCFTNTPAS